MERADFAHRLLDLVDAGARLSAEENELLEQVKRLVDSQIAPQAAHYDETKAFPQANIDKLNELGLNAMILPEDCGGVALSYAAYLATLREISRGCASTGLTWATNFHATNPIVDAGTAEQKQRFLPQIAEGGLAAIAITEPGGGSDATAMKTTFTPDGDDIVIDGEKIYITNGDVAQVVLVFGKWAPLGSGRQALSAVIVPAPIAGLVVRRREDKLGHRASSTAALGFEGVRVPRANLLGAPGEGTAILLQGLNKSRPSVAAHCLGIALAAYEDFLAYGRTRIIRGKPLIDFPTTQANLAILTAELVSCTNLLWSVAAWERHDTREFATIAGILKLKASELAISMTEAALQLHGGAGYCREFRAERLMRDARLGPVGEGASEVLREVIGRTVASAERK